MLRIPEMPDQLRQREHRPGTAGAQVAREDPARALVSADPEQAVAIRGRLRNLAHRVPQAASLHPGAASGLRLGLGSWLRPEGGRGHRGRRVDPRQRRIERRHRRKPLGRVLAQAAGDDLRQGRPDARVQQAHLAVDPSGWTRPDGGLGAGGHEEEQRPEAVNVVGDHRQLALFPLRRHVAQGALAK